MLAQQVKSHCWQRSCWCSKVLMNSYYKPRSVRKRIMGLNVLSTACKQQFSQVHAEHPIAPHMQICCPPVANYLHQTADEAYCIPLLAHERLGLWSYERSGFLHIIFSSDALRSKDSEVLEPSFLLVCTHVALRGLPPKICAVYFSKDGQ